MAGIVSYGAYVPMFRLSPQTANWPHATTRAVANFDEDAVTMAVAAGRACLTGQDGAMVDALYLASTSLPYAEKQSASLVATALDLRPDILAVDIAHSLRAATQALALARDAVAAGSARAVLVIATDCRTGAPGSDLERDGGDAAVALLVARDRVVVEFGPFHVEVNDILDVWRPDGDRLLRATTEDHFRYEDGYLHAMVRAAEGFAGKTGRALSSFARVALYAPDARRRAEAVRRLTISPEQSVAPLAASGSAGVACALMQFVQALEASAPGDDLLLLNYGDGADACAFTAGSTLPALAQRRRPVARFAGEGVPVADHYKYLGWRGLGIAGRAPATRMAPAPHALYRDQDQVVRFRGMRCTACGMVQYPAQRVCVRCQAKDAAEAVNMAGGGATLFSYSMDHVALTPDTPLVHGVVDFEVGGRAMMLITDRDLDAIRIGMPLDLVFRKFSESDGVHTYLWKAMPSR